jgi:DNA-binding MarR family transcriptional regulator
MIGVPDSLSIGSVDMAACAAKPGVSAQRGAEDTEPAGAARVRSPAAKARAMLAKREALKQHLDPSLCVNPAVDILLFLLGEAEEGKRTNTTACCDAVRTPRATAIRWIARLEEHDLVDSHGDPADRRVTLLSLTAKGHAALEGWMRSIDAL